MEETIFHQVCSSTKFSWLILAYLLICRIGTGTEVPVPLTVTYLRVIQVIENLMCAKNLGFKLRIKLLHVLGLFPF